MAMRIKGSVGNTPIDLTITCDEDLLNMASELLDFCNRQNKTTTTCESELHNTVPTSTHSKTASRETPLLKRALDYIEKEKQVTNYQLVDFLSGLEGNEQSVKQTIMRLKHHSNVRLTTESATHARTDHLVFHWDNTTTET
ncbi:hypothetical protein [Zooshikella harenae]|uniref:Uncharacterized protein n=1 Tax=Zooshikella harenae TaxID=2827238 RepID=A0ABS5ZEK1_9GAMM|nr:hypothetical protein [Zooshikella harenae]MBU2712415.1 hypothetical protein [Zooshikella harenae]